MRRLQRAQLFEDQEPEDDSGSDRTVSQEADRGVMALLSAGGRSYGVIFFSDGSSKASADFLKIMDSLRPG